MELLTLLKVLADVGVTPPVLVIAGLVWQQQKTNALMDKRVALLEQTTQKCGDC